MTITSTTDAVINALSVSNTFSIKPAASGTSIRDLNFVSGPSNVAMIGVQANNVTIDNNSFTGSYDHGDPEVSRAVVVSPGVSNFVMTNNYVSHLRQPAYIDDNVNGLISSNCVEVTKGFVIGTNSTLTILDNEWGTGVNRNAVDIALINASNSPTPVNNYDAQTLSADNNNATADDQVTNGVGSHTFTTVYVDASAAPGGDGTWLKPLQSIQAGINAVDDGGVVNVASGNYIENITISKSVELYGPNSNVNPVTTTRGTEAVITGQVNVFASYVIIDGFTITNPSYFGPTVKGVHIYSAGPTVEYVAIRNNVITDITNLNNKGAYGVMIQGDTNYTFVYDNLIQNISAPNGWARGIEVTPTNNSTLVPQNVTITGNLIRNITGLDAYAFSIDKSDTMTADASQVTFQNNQVYGAVRNLDDTQVVSSGNVCDDATCPSVTNITPAAPAAPAPKPSTAKPVATTTTTTGGTVASANTSSDTDSNDATNEPEAVLGTSAGTSADSTVKDKAAITPKPKNDDSSAFLGLGWWWIPVLMIVIGAAGVAGNRYLNTNTAK